MLGKEQMAEVGKRGDRFKRKRTIGGRERFIKSTNSQNKNC